MFPALPDSLGPRLWGVCWVGSGAVKAAEKMDEDGRRHRWGRSRGAAFIGASTRLRPRTLRGGCHSNLLPRASPGGTGLLGALMVPDRLGELGQSLFITLPPSVLQAPLLAFSPCLTHPSLNSQRHLSWGPVGGMVHLEVEALGQLACDAGCWVSFI